MPPNAPLAGASDRREKQRQWNFPKNLVVATDLNRSFWLGRKGIAVDF
jgi:hypothetical protein